MSLLLKDIPGVYRVILPRVERVVAEAHALFVKFENVFNREEVYTYALGMINEMEMEDYNFHLQYLELEEYIEKFSKIIMAYYEQSLPEELRNDECFSLAIVEYNDEADIYIFTCEIPPSYAVDKHGIDFDFLNRYFPKGSG